MGFAAVFLATSIFITTNAALAMSNAVLAASPGPEEIISTLKHCDCIDLRSGQHVTSLFGATESLHVFVFVPVGATVESLKALPGLRALQDEYGREDLTETFILLGSSERDAVEVLAVLPISQLSSVAFLNSQISLSDHPTSPEAFLIVTYGSSSQISYAIRLDIGDGKPSVEGVRSALRDYLSHR